MFPALAWRPRPPVAERHRVDAGRLAGRVHDGAREEGASGSIAITLGAPNAVGIRNQEWAPWNSCCCT